MTRKHNPGPPETGEARRAFIGDYLGKPVPVKYMHDSFFKGNGEVRITTPADPEKVKAYHESREYKNAQRSKLTRIDRKGFN